MSRQRGAWEEIGDETWDRGVRRKKSGSSERFDKGRCSAEADVKFHDT